MGVRYHHRLPGTRTKSANAWQPSAGIGLSRKAAEVLRIGRNSQQIPLLQPPTPAILITSRSILIIPALFLTSQDLCLSIQPAHLIISDPFLIIQQVFW
jgi:hypothetical protein